ncbi:MAG: heme o synthase [Chloroflexia bacterium]
MGRAQTEERRPFVFWTLNRPLFQNSRFKIQSSTYARLTAATAAAVWAVIVLGGLVRVTNSGTGCGSSWPMCNGHFLPALEYHQLIEWNHRLFATLVGGLMALTVGSTLLWYRRPRRLLWLALFAAATYIGQALLGAITVFLHLDHTWVAAHMGNSMLLLASVILLAFFARQRAGEQTTKELTIDDRRRTMEANEPASLPPSSIVYRLSSGAATARRLSLATLLATYVAMLTGSAVVGAQADVSCPAWPQCSETALLPATAEQWINFGHRAAVGLSDVLMLALALLIWRTRPRDPRLMRAAHVLAGLYVSQVFLGAFTIWLRAPEALRGAHLALAAATWGALVVLAALVWSGAPAPVDGMRPGERGGFRIRGVRRLARRVLPEGVRLYVGLMRPHVIPLLLVPAAASMLIAAVQYPPQRPLLGLLALTMLGGTLAAGGAHAINQYLDRDIDALMRRTRRRPVVTGRIPPRNALLFGLILSGLSVAVLWFGVNPVAALLAFAGNAFYVLVYTIWLKRSSVQNIVIGGAAGAVPPLVGWAAVTGDVGVPALLFFAIIFFWTPAHFWALALVRQDDYREAGIPMLPVVQGEEATRTSILRYVMLLVCVSLLPTVLHALGWLYLSAAALLGLMFAARALQLSHHSSPARAWGLFKFSNSYLALLYLAMVVDRLFALGGRLFL